MSDDQHSGAILWLWIAFGLTFPLIACLLLMLIVNLGVT